MGYGVEYAVAFHRRILRLGHTTGLCALIALSPLMDRSMENENLWELVDKGGKQGYLPMSQVLQHLRLTYEPPNLLGRTAYPFLKSLLQRTMDLTRNPSCVLISQRWTPNRFLPEKTEVPVSHAISLFPEENERCWVIDSRLPETCKLMTQGETLRHVWSRSDEGLLPYAGVCSRI